ncbi:hypothetical protein GCM10007063_17340 [Lentibacillus kapialis]|uniref:DUF2929 family protein n=1 Tax=Lentibacillus kapialis TaxID=340214 RepID=A0A917PWI2_9BACI|nr:DUF2929 family protein [Lentibacillus kapialis]GGJ95361.1 hypothetical protein GCM10007063_17340 [Lentibacillus kapialis]
MRFLWPLIWAFLISCVVSYVLVSMAGNDFDIVSTFGATIVITLAVFILGEGVLKGESEY